jgi:hypothetical protein
MEEKTGFNEKNKILKTLYSDEIGYGKFIWSRSRKLNPLRLSRKSNILSI